MTDLDKQLLYTKEYKRALKWCKHKYKEYEPFLRIPLESRRKIEGFIKCMWDELARCGISIYNRDGAEPMSDVADIQLNFKDEGNPMLKEIMVSSKTSCWSVLMVEQTMEEIEADARRIAELEVELAEHREKKLLEEAEEKRKAEEAKAAEEKAKAEHLEKCKADADEFQAKLEAEKKELETWYCKVRDELDKMRTGRYSWFAEVNLEEREFAAVKKYVEKLRDFTDAQNAGLTGYGLYAQNEARARAHEDLLDVFGLADNKYAVHVTKSYDFTDDYDSRTSQYKHIDEETSIDMLGYALVQARLEGMK